MNPIKLYVRAGATLLAIVILLISRTPKRNTQGQNAPTQKPLPELDEYVKLAAAVAGLLAAAQIIYQVFTVSELQQILEIDGCVALVIGAGALAYIAGQEIRQLL